jgi:hypothetical protein
MDVETAEITIKIYLTKIRDHLEKATKIARTAQACADAGNVEKGLEIALEVEGFVREANTFLNAASTIHLMARH